MHEVVSKAKVAARGNAVCIYRYNNIWTSIDKAWREEYSEMLSWADAIRFTKDFRKESGVDYSLDTLLAISMRIHDSIAFLPGVEKAKVRFVKEFFESVYAGCRR